METRKMPYPVVSTQLGGYAPAVDSALVKVEQDRIAERIWAHDHTVWKPDPTEISNRLGWLRIAEAMEGNVERLKEFADAVRADGYTHVLLLGMGGSSLAPDVFRNAFGPNPGYLDLAVLDSTDPGAVQAHADRLDPVTTLFIVSTKSGGTVETRSFFKFFYNLAQKVVGSRHVGSHFVAITDPGSSLEETAQALGFRRIFLNDPNIGGRYSALSYFGMVPAALLGVDIERILASGRRMARLCVAPEVTRNPGVYLGVVLGELAKAGREKVTFLTSKALANFGDWVEQLIAESTGKEGKGILPVIDESLGAPEIYGDDRVFVSLRLNGDAAMEERLHMLAAAGHPIIEIDLSDEYEMGGQFFLWEMATAVAGHCLGIQPFDQPNVESAKVLAKEMMARYAETGVFPTVDEVPPDSDVFCRFLDESMVREEAAGLSRPYIAVHAYLEPTQKTNTHLLELQSRLRQVTHLAATVGYGPRFLHSTGQLHKGDAGTGLFIQLVASSSRDVSIPDEAGKQHSTMSFGALKKAQGLGDYQALRAAGRRVIRVHLGHDIAGGIQAMLSVIK